MKLHKVLQSSMDKEKLSLTIGGILGTMLVLFSFMGYNNLFDVKELTEVILELVEGILVIAGVITTLIGLLRKIYIKIKNKK